MGEEAGGVEGQPGARVGGEEAEGEDTEWAEGRIRSLKMRVGKECSISRRRDKSFSGGIRVGGVRGESHSVMSGDTAGEQLQE